MNIDNLINLNGGAAILHMLLLFALILYYVWEKPDMTAISLFQNSNEWKNEAERCKCWSNIGLKSSWKIDLFWLTFSFTLITVLAHLFYAINPGGAYLNTVRTGKNPFRWVEYALSATIMQIILAILAGVRNESTIIVISVAVFATMLQGYTIESQISSNSGLIDKIVPCVAGWALLVGSWVPIFKQWYHGMNEAFDNVEKCRYSTNGASGFDANAEPPKFIQHLIIIVFALFSSFGFINLAYVVRKDPGNFVMYEFAYIVLSFVAKSLLVIWCMSSIFNGELAWLQPRGSADVPAPCIPFDKP